MDNNAPSSLAFDELTAATLTGVVIFDSAHGEIGRVSHLHGEGADSGIIVDIGDRQVAVPSNEIDFRRDDHGEIHGISNWSREELEAMPPHEHDG